ncbi:MAG: MotA/TolQ/ExbB proton channel family protein [Pirellulales bacterium]
MAPRAVAENVADAAKSAASDGYTFWEIVFSGGPIGISIMVVLILASIAAVALAIEQWLTIRRDALIPPKLSDEVRALLAAGQLATAQNQCRQQDSFLSFVLSRGLGEADGGWDAVEKAMEEAATEQSARLMRRVEYLSVIASIAPMLGLLGTVAGMIMAFKQVAESQGAARPAELAEGIYTALVTTVVALMIAIPSLAAFAMLRNRVDELVAEAIYAAEHATLPLKRFVRQRGKVSHAQQHSASAATTSTASSSGTASSGTASGAVPVPPPPPERRSPA